MMKRTTRHLAESEKAKLLHQMSIDEIESTISLPASFFTWFPDRVRLTYLKEGQTRTLVLFPDEVAKLLKEEQKIYTYAYTPTGVLMYNVTEELAFHDDGTAYIQWHPVPFDWSAVSFSALDVVRYCAEHEWKQTAGRVVTGLFSMFRTIKNAIG